MNPTAVDGVLVVGGGYAGVHAARALSRAGKRAHVVDPTGRHDFVTRLAAVAGGTTGPDDASAALSDFSDHVIVGTMTGLEDGAVRLDDGRELEADCVIVTSGAGPTTPPIPGIDHAAPLRTAEDALALRARIDDADAVVIVGGGATGVQLAGAIAIRHRRTNVVLIEAEDRLLPSLSADLGQGAQRILEDRSVRLRLGATVDQIDQSSVVVDGERIDGVVVWAAGFAPRLDGLDVPVTSSGRIAVDDTLLVRGWHRTFAAGDIAAHVDADGAELAMSAQIAVQAGDAAGSNAVRLLDGVDLVPSALTHRGWVLDLGGCRGVGEVGPASFGAPVLDLVPPLLHWGIDAKHLVDTQGIAGLLGRRH